MKLQVTVLTSAFELISAFLLTSFGGPFLPQQKNVFFTDLLKAGITTKYTNGLKKQLKEVPHNEKDW